MDKATILAEINRLAQMLEESEKPSAPAIRTVKIGDLEWQADVPDKTFTWEEAKAYATSLGDGWRLPTIQELLTLVDYTKIKPSCVFPDCPSACFWSSSAYAGNSTAAWNVDFYNGDTNYFDVGDDGRVRCVR